MKRNQAYVLLVGLLIIVLFLAGLYWSSVDSKLNKSITTNDLNNAPADNVDGITPGAYLFTQSQLKQLYGEAYPLLLGPVDGQYKLKGLISGVIIADEVLVDQFTSRAHGQFEYLDHQNNKQVVKVPLVVDNLQTGQSVFLLGSISDSLASKERISQYIQEELGYANDSVELSVSFAKPKDEGDMMLAENILRDAINTLHPDGFTQFVETGAISDVGNENGWLVPIYISN